jgi:hypothetical protein
MTPSVVDRLGHRIAALAAITNPGAGVNRPPFSPRERDAHAAVAGWAAEAGASAEVDAAGNTLMIFRPGEPYLLIGSHLDTPPDGGRFDGVVGVLAALEVALALGDEIGLGLRVVVFSAEEGYRFGAPCLGSGTLRRACSARSRTPTASPPGRPRRRPDWIRRRARRGSASRRSPPSSSSTSSREWCSSARACASASSTSSPARAGSS